MFALGMLGLGVLTLFYGEISHSIGSRFPDWVPAPSRPGLCLCLRVVGGGGACAAVGAVVRLRAPLFLMGLPGHLLGFCPSFSRPAPKTGQHRSVVGLFAENRRCHERGWDDLVRKSLRNDAFLANVSLGLFGRLFACCMGSSHFCLCGILPRAWVPALVTRNACGWPMPPAAVSCRRGELAMLLSWQTRWPRGVEGIMMSSFVLLVHLPSLWDAARRPAWGPTAGAPN